MAQTQYKFDVQMLDFSAQNLQPKQAGSVDPYLKLDFDNFKLFKTDKETKNLNPQWGFQKRFTYRTKFLDKLSRKRFRIQCYDHNVVSQADFLGETSIDLLTLATGPRFYQMTLVDQGRPVGSLKFTCVMKMLSDVTVNLSNLALTMQGQPCGASLQAFTSMQETQQVAFPFSPQGRWPEARGLTFETSLWDLLGPEENESVRVQVLDGQGGMMGDCVIPFYTHFSLQAGQNIPFKVPVRSGGGNVGELSGTLTFANLPTLAQMAGGTVQDERVLGGYLLYRGVTYPPSLQQPPAVLQVQRPGDAGMGGQSQQSLPQMQQQQPMQQAYGGQPAMQQQQYGGYPQQQMPQQQQPLSNQAQQQYGGYGGMPQQQAPIPGPQQSAPYSQPQIPQGPGPNQSGPLAYGSQPQNPYGQGYGQVQQQGPPSGGPGGYQQPASAPGAQQGGPSVAVANANQMTSWDYMDGVELPPNWEMRKDRRTGRPYFADHRSKKTCWTDPRFLPENWDQRIDPNTGRVYYAYHKTKKTSFIDPRGSPPGWEMRLSANGEVYFAYHPAKQTCFTDPRGLPETHSCALDPQGRMYFKNHTNKSTQWEDPRSGVAESVLELWRTAERERWWNEQKGRYYEERRKEEQEADARERLEGMAI